MKFNTDSYIEIGKSHEVCEDYATHGIISEIPYIIISDGCSSSEDTDVGARLLVHACRNALFEIINHSLLEALDNTQLQAYLKEQILFNLKLSLKALFLKDTVADATLLLSFIYNETIYAFVYGDGHIIINYDDNTMTSCKVEYAENAPPYISYDLNIHRKHLYLEQFGKTNANIIVNGGGTESVYEYSLNEWINKFNACHFITTTAKDAKSITLSSDGIESYMYGKTSTPSQEERLEITKDVKWYNEYTSYKGALGEFVKRRMKRIKLNNEKQNIEHYDDVSCATIWINHE